MGWPWLLAAGLDCSGLLIGAAAGELYLVLDEELKRASVCAAWEAEDHALAAMVCREEEGAKQGGATAGARGRRRHELQGDLASSLMDWELGGDSLVGSVLNTRRNWRGKLRCPNPSN